MTQNEETWSVYILCRLKDSAFESKVIESQEQWCAGKSVLWGSRGARFTELANLCRVNVATIS